jgi:hypothetical protein
MNGNHLQLGRKKLLVFNHSFKGLLTFSFYSIDSQKHPILDKNDQITSLYFEH